MAPELGRETGDPRETLRGHARVMSPLSAEEACLILSRCTASVTLGTERIAQAVQEAGPGRLVPEVPGQTQRLGEQPVRPLRLPWSRARYPNSLRP